MEYRIEGIIVGIAQQIGGHPYEGYDKSYSCGQEHDCEGYCGLHGHGV